MQRIFGSKNLRPVAEIRSGKPRHSRCSPDAGEPGLLLARQPRRAVIVPELRESRGRQVAAPGLEVVIRAITSAVPAFLVVSARIRAEKDPARLQRRAQLP